VLGLQENETNTVTYQIAVRFLNFETKSGLVQNEHVR